MNTRFITATTLAAGAVLLAGCAAGGADETSRKAPPHPEGVIDKSDARVLLDRYVKINNQANEHTDPKRLAQVECGALLEASKAEYKQAADEEYDSWYYKRPAAGSYHIPAKSSGATWFALSPHAYGKSDGPESAPSVTVFDRAEGHGWRMAAAAWIKSEIADRIAHDKNGHAIPVAPTTKIGGVTPNDLDDAVADLYVTGGRKAGAVFKESRTTKAMKDEPREENKDLSPHGRATYRKGETAHKNYALKTKDGGALVLFASPVEETAAGATLGATVTPSREMKPFVGKQEQPMFEMSFLHRSIAYLPLKGKAELLSSKVEMTDAR